MLERARELAVCTSAVDAAARGAGTTIVIEGPAGIGKSTLLDAVADDAKARHAQVVRARGTDIDRNLPFAGIRRALAPHLGARDAGIPAVMSRGTTSGGGVRSARRDPPDIYAAVDALYWQVAELAASDPVVLAFDDAHWLDAGTVRFLAHLESRIDDMRAVIFVATRPVRDTDDAVLARVVTAPQATVLPLGPLSDAAVEELVRSCLPAAGLDEALVGAITSATGGNPFYVRELLRDVLDGRVHPGAVDLADVAWAAPRGVLRGLQLRAAADPERTAVARAVALLGTEARPATVAAHAGRSMDAVGRSLDELVRDGVIRSFLGAGRGEPIAFTHPIVQAAVLDDMGPMERAAGHKRAAQVLDGPAVPAAVVGTHLMDAMAQGDPWVVDRLRAAADEATHAGAPDTAASLLRRALDEPPPAGARVAVTYELAVAEARAAMPEATAHFDAVVHEAEDPDLRAQAAIEGAIGSILGGRPESASRLLSDAIRELPNLAPDRALEAEARVIMLAMYLPDIGRDLRARVDRFDEDTLGASLGERLMLSLIGYLRMWRSKDAARSVAASRRALAGTQLAEERGSETPEVGNSAMVLIYADALGDAAALIDLQFSDARRRGSRYGFAIASCLAATLCNRRGEPIEAAAHAEAAAHITRQTRDPIPDAVVAAELVIALSTIGKVDEARRQLVERNLWEATLPMDAPFMALVVARGRLRVQLGDVAGGLGDLLDCGRRMHTFGARNPVFMPWAGIAALTLRAQGDLVLARSIAQQQLDAASDWGTPGAIGSALRVAALVGLQDEVDALDAAVGCLRRSPARLELARALVDLGSVHRRAGRRRDAEAHLKEALDTADRANARPLAEAARDELGALGLRPRRNRITGVAALTPSELRVARLAVDGMSNVEIAQTLFVTRKTVEKHLGNAYGKLGVTGRGQLEGVLSEA